MSDLNDKFSHSFNHHDEHTLNIIMVLRRAAMNRLEVIGVIVLPSGDYFKIKMTEQT